MLMRRVLLSFMAIFFALSFIYSQSISPSVINSSGGSFNDPNYYFRLDWSVGEMPLVNTKQSLGGGGVYVLTNGFFQPYTNTPGSINNSGGFGPEEIKIFPNPAVNFVEIDIMTKQKGTFNMSLYNELGQRIYYRTFQTNGLDRIEKIKLDGLAAGTYMLLIDMDPESGSTAKKGAFKIIKLR